MNASNSKRNVPVGGLASQKKYADRNLNAVVKAPVVHHGSNKYMQVLHTGKQAKPSKAIGVAAAPTPVNTSSLKRENNGRDVGVNLVPISNAVWGQSEGKVESTEKPQQEVPAKPPVSTSIAPWAEKSATQKVISSQASEDKPRVSWAVDSDDEEDECEPSPPVEQTQPAQNVHTGFGAIAHGEEREYPSAAFQPYREPSYIPPSSSSKEGQYRPGAYPFSASRQHSDPHQRYGSDQLPLNSRADAAFGPPSSNRDFSSHFQRQTVRGPHQTGYHREHYNHGDSFRGGNYNDARSMHPPHHRHQPHFRRHEQMHESSAVPAEERAIEESRKEREALERRKQEQQLRREEEERRQLEVSQKSCVGSSDRWERGRPIVPKDVDELPNKYAHAQRGSHDFVAPRSGGPIFPSNHPQLMATASRSSDVNRPPPEVQRSPQQPVAWKSSQVNIERPVILSHSATLSGGGDTGVSSRVSQAPQPVYEEDSPQSHSTKEEEEKFQPKKILPPPQRMLYDPKRNTMVATSGLSEAVAEGDVHSNFSMQKRPPRDTTAHDAQVRARREARLAEKIDHGPRSRGLLYRYNAVGDLELVLSPVEQAKLDADRALIREKQAARQAAIEAKTETESGETAEKVAASSRKKSKRDAGSKKTHKKEKSAEAQGSRLKLEEADFVDDEELLEVQRNSVEFMEVKSRKALQQERKETKRESAKPQKSENKNSSGSAVPAVSSLYVAAVSLPPRTEISPVQLGPPPAKAWVEPKHTLETLGVKALEQQDDEGVATIIQEAQENVPIAKVSESEKKVRTSRKRENKKESVTKSSTKPSLNTSMIRQHLGFKLADVTESSPDNGVEQSFTHFSAQIESFGEGQDAATFTEDYFNAADRFMQFTADASSESRLLNKVIQTVDDEAEMHTQWAIDMVDEGSSADMASSAIEGVGGDTTKSSEDRGTDSCVGKGAEWGGHDKRRHGGRTRGRGRGKRGRGRGDEHQIVQQDVAATHDEKSPPESFTSKRLRRPSGRVQRGARRGRSNLPRSGPPAMPVTGDRTVE